jgi:hypothetical protein
MTVKITRNAFDSAATAFEADAGVALLLPGLLLLRTRGCGLLG